MINYELENDKVNDFINSLIEVDTDIETIKEYATSNDVPIIRDETRNLLRLLLVLKKPKKILELGTAIAYSTLVIYKALNKEIDKFVTVENNIERINVAKKNIEKYFEEKSITLIEDDATNYLKENHEKEVFDFIFLDAAKAQYIVWLPYIKNMMKKGSVLLSDNIFKDGEILMSRYAIIKRDRTIHKRMREFLHTISNDDDFNTNLFNLGDGISVSIKK